MLLVLVKSTAGKINRPKASQRIMASEARRKSVSCLVEMQSVPPDNRVMVCLLCHNQSEFMRLFFILFTKFFSKEMPRSLNIIMHNINFNEIKVDEKSLTFSPLLLYISVLISRMCFNF